MRTNAASALYESGRPYIAIGEYPIWRLLVFAPKVLRLDLMAIGRAWSAACKRPYFYSPAQRPIFDTAQQPRLTR